MADEEPEMIVLSWYSNTIQYNNTLLILKKDTTHLTRKIDVDR